MSTAFEVLAAAVPAAFAAYLVGMVILSLAAKLIDSGRPVRALMGFLIFVLAVGTSFAIVFSIILFALIGPEG